MNRQEFMKRLEELLTDISAEEREEALAYYTSYFEDAGEENEEKIIRELESPEKLAASIKAGLKEDAAGEYTEHGYRDTRDAGQNIPPAAPERASTAQKDKHKTLLILLIVVLAVLTIPVWGGLLGGIFGFAAGIFGLLIGIAAALFGLTIAGIVGGTALFGAGILRLCTGGLASGIMMMGIGILLVALGVLALALLVLFCGRFLPWLIRSIVKLCRMPFQKKRERCKV